MKAACRFDTFH